MKNTSILASLVVASLLPMTVHAQSADDEVAAAIAALPVVTAKTQGPVEVVFSDGTVRLSTLLSEKLGKKLEHESTRLNCRRDSTGECVYSLKNASVTLINIADVYINGDKATVMFDIETAGDSKRVPVENEIFKVDLARVANVWVVKRARTTMIG